MHQLPHPYPVFHRPRAQGSSRIRLCAYHLLQLPSKREVRLMTNKLAETLWGRLSTCGRLADRKSTRLNSSHLGISYAVFCLKKKQNKNKQHEDTSTVKSINRLDYINRPL